MGSPQSDRKCTETGANTFEINIYKYFFNLFLYMLRFIRKIEDILDFENLSKPSASTVRVARCQD